MRNASTSWRAGAALVVAAAAMITMLPTTALGQPRHRVGTKVQGAWANPVGACVGHIISFDPSTGAFTCTGTSEWAGTWTGSTTWTSTGKLDLVTGAGSGRIHEVFTGHAADGRTGKLTFVERFRLDASGHIDIRGHIVCSYGGLAGSHGHARWVGTQSMDGSGVGTYSGRWHEGGRHHGRCHTP